jgi:hypothetical protein
MSLILVIFAIPLAYLILVAVKMLPHDLGMFTLVFLNSVAWSVHYKLKSQIKHELSKRTVRASKW